MIFQPFTIFFYSIGAGLVVLGGLAFNLIPFAREGVPLSKLGRVGLIVLAILAIAIILGIGTGYLYVWYLGLFKRLEVLFSDARRSRSSLLAGFARRW